MISTNDSMKLMFQVRGVALQDKGKLWRCLQLGAVERQGVLPLVCHLGNPGSLLGRVASGRQVWLGGHSPLCLQAESITAWMVTHLHFPYQLLSLAHCQG